MLKKTLICCLFAVALGWSCGNASADLQAHWTLDEDANDSVGDSHGVIYGAVSTIGKIDGALSFDGEDDYILIDHSDIGNPAGSFSVTAWAKLIDQGSGGSFGDNDNIIAKHSGFAGYYIEYNWESSIGIRAGFGNGSSWNRIFGSPWGIGDWHHVALIYDADLDQAEFFDNGVSQGTLTNYTPQYHTRDLTIGSGTVSSQFFPGAIDDVRIYDHALSQEEIRALVPEPTALSMLALAALGLRLRKKSQR